MGPMSQMQNPKPLESYSTNLNDLARDGEFDFISSNEKYILNTPRNPMQKN